MLKITRKRRTTRPTVDPGDLLRFLDTLSPILGRHVQGDLTKDDLAAWLAENDARAQRLGEQYERVASGVPRGFMARVRVTGRHVLEAFFVNLKRRPGALRIPDGEKAAVKAARDVAQVEEELRKAYQCAREIFADPSRRAGSYRSSPELVEEEMLAQGLAPHHIQAVIKATSLTSAAHSYVAKQTGRTPASVKAMASKGRKWLREHPSESGEG